MKANLSFFFILFFFSPAQASWEKQKDDELKVQLGFITSKYAFDIKAPENKGDAKFEPSTPTKTALSLSYRNLGLALSTSSSRSEESEKLYGTSTSQDIQLRFFGKKSYEFYYQNYDGYYISNSEKLDPNYSDKKEKIQRPDIRSRNFGFNFLWSIHENDFSQAIAFDQAGRQTGPGWGTSWIIHASDSKISGDSPFIPSGNHETFQDLADIDEVQRKTIATGITLGGITTYHSFYATGILGLGFGYQNLIVDSSDLNIRDTSDNFGTYSTFRMGLGYNGEKNVVGIQVLVDSVNSKYADGEINGSTLDVSVFYAYRFSGMNISLLNTASGWLD